VEDGKYKLNYTPKERKPISDWMFQQERFRHLKKPEHQGMIDDIQKDIDARWEHLNKKCTL